jgi:hypothetical protein
VKEIEFSKMGGKSAVGANCCGRRVGKSKDTFLKIIYRK